MRGILRRSVASIAPSVILVGVVGIACDPSSSTCDPLGPAPQSIVLGEIVGAGEDAQGKIYVVDRVDTESRVFVEDDGALVHYPVSAEGGGGGGGGEVMTVLVSEPDVSFLVQIESSAAGTRMGVLFDPGAAELFEIGTEGEELAVLPAESVADMPIDNVAAHVELEYVARLDDGRLLVVSRPKGDWDYEDFRAFFGPVDALAERHVTMVERLKDGGSTTIELEIDGATATASFPVVSMGSDFVPGPATLTVAGATQPLQRLPHVVPENAAFDCLDPA